MGCYGMPVAVPDCNACLQKCLQNVCWLIKLCSVPLLQFRVSLPNADGIQPLKSERWTAHAYYVIGPYGPLMPIALFSGVFFVLRPRAYACVILSGAWRVIGFGVCLTKPTPTPTQYVVNTLYWPHTALSVYLVCYFLVPHTHVLCMGSGSATGKKNQVRLVHSLLKYFLKFQLWYWIKNLHYQIFKLMLLIILILVWIVCSTYRNEKRRNFDAKVTCHQPICLLLHAILSGVGVRCTPTLQCTQWVSGQILCIDHIRHLVLNY